LMLLAMADHGADGPAVVACLVLILGTAVLAGGFGKYAVYHGRSPWWGLLSLLSILGVMFIFVAVGEAKHRQLGGFEVLYAPEEKRDIWKMDVRIRVEESLGVGVWEPIHMQLPRGASVMSAAKTLAEAVPALGESVDSAIFRVNGKPAKPSDDLSDGDELVIAGNPPPVAADQGQPVA
ncbi:MAG: MoaD/ThiS family protein, partial [Bryobacteraceae bacterium]